MEPHSLLTRLADSPVIASVKDQEGLTLALDSPAEVLFLLFGDLLRIAPMVEQVHRARQRGLTAIQRFFLLDSMALDNIQKHLAQDSPDLIEVLPGLMPKIIRQLTGATRCPVIAGGLISDKEDVLGALSAGAVAVSATSPAVWQM